MKMGKSGFLACPGRIGDPVDTMLGARERSSQRGIVRGWHAGVWPAIVLAMATAQCASAKGFVSFPPSRKMMILETGSQPLPNNAGGAELEFHKGHGLCGALGKDADLDVDATISPNAFFTEGDVIDVDVTLESHRKGHFEFRLCSLDANDFSQECLNEHVLEFDAAFTVSSYSGQMDDAMRWSPADLLENEACKSDDGTPLGSCCNHGGTCSDEAHNRHRWAVPSSAAGPMYTMRLVLPKGVRCEHCVLQWYYQTGDERGSFHGYPEGFWDCADVAIREKTVLTSSEVKRRKLLAILPASAKARDLGSDDKNVEVGIDLSLLGETTSAPTNAPSFASTSAPTRDQAQMLPSNETSIDDEVPEDGSGSANVDNDDDDDDKSEEDSTNAAATVSTTLIVGASVSAAGAVFMLVALLRMRHKRSHGVLEAIPVSLHAERSVNAYPSPLSRVRGLFSRSRATDRHAFTAKEVEAVVIESPVDH